VLQGLDQITDLFLLKGAGIRTRVALVLLGVAGLVVPQVALTLDYMMDLFAAGASIQATSDLDHEVAGARREITTLLLGRGGDTSSGGEERLREIGARLEAPSGVLDEATRAAVGRTRQALQAYSDARRAATERAPQAHPWIQALEDARSEVDLLIARHAATPTDDTGELRRRLRELEAATTGLPGKVAGQALLADLFGPGGLGIPGPRAAGWAALDALDGLRQALATEIKDAARGVRDRVDVANRYLVTLLLVTLVYLVVVIFMLPARLVRPLHHLTAVMRQAGVGHLSGRVRVVGKDEVGQLSAAANELLDRVERFDILKRDRIYQDHRRIRRLAELASQPLAILDTRLRLEHANQAFQRLFNLKKEYEDARLIDLVAGKDAEALRELLEAALRSGEPTQHLLVELQSDQAVTRWQVTIELGRNSTGRVSYLYVWLTPGGGA
jgi:PAS domain-containing protein